MSASSKPASRPRGVLRDLSDGSTPVAAAPIARWFCVLVLLAGGLHASGCAGVEVIRPAEPPSVDRLDDPAATLPRLRASAINEVLSAVRSDNPQLRANALEALQDVRERVLPLAQLALDDSNAGVRFASLWVIGEQRLTSLAPALRPMLDEDQPEVVQAAAIYAAARLGVADDSLISRMSRYALHPDARVRSTAAMLLGRMSDASAVPLLKHSSRRPPGNRQPEILWKLLRLQVAEAMAKLGEGDAIKALYAAAYADDPELRILAVQTLAGLEDVTFWSNMSKFLGEDPIELRVAAAAGLVELASASAGRGVTLLQEAVREGAVPVLLEATHHELPTVRGQAAIGLTTVRTPAAAAALARLLRDGDPGVRLAAAAGVLRQP